MKGTDGWSRTCRLAEVTKEMNGEPVTVMGFVREIRDVGKLKFVLLADITGTLQVIFKEGTKAFDAVSDITRESAIGVKGTVSSGGKRRIILGTYMRAAGFRDAYYMKALKVRSILIKEFKAAFKNVDAIATPSMPMLPPRFDDIAKLSPLEIYNMDKMTTAPNLCGFPTISMPVGTSQGLPAGMQLIADHFMEGRLISLAAAAEVIK